MSQLVEEPTRVTCSTANILDFVITTRPETATLITVRSGISFPAAVHFTMSYRLPRIPRQHKLIRNYKQANFEVINDELASFSDEFPPHFGSALLMTTGRSSKQKLRPLQRNISLWFE